MCKVGNAESVETFSEGEFKLLGLIKVLMLDVPEIEQLIKEGTEAEQFEAIWNACDENGRDGLRKALTTLSGLDENTLKC